VSAPEDTQVGRAGTEPIRLRVVMSMHPERRGLLSLRAVDGAAFAEVARALVVAGYRPGDIVELRLVRS
jgi:hypothetical protein